MPITRRRRANPPDQPENNHHQQADQTEGAVEQPLHAEPAPASPLPEPVGNVENPSPEEVVPPAESPAAAAPQSVESTHAQAPLPPSNGDRAGGEYTPTIEGGRRTARGELFRRPPQAPPQQPQASFVSSAPLQAPTHE